MSNLGGIDYKNLVGAQIKMLEGISKTTDAEIVLLVSRELREIMQFALSVGVQQADSVE